MHINQMQLSIGFTKPGPQLRDLIALRKLVDGYRTMSPADLKAHVSGRTRLEIGLFGSIEGRRLMSEARRVGLTVESENASYTSYSLVDVTEPQAPQVLLIESKDEAERVAKEMIASGCRVIPGEAC